MGTPVFEVIPAIDLRAGRCVRLFQGSFERETVYSDEPVAVARAFAAAGAPRIHVVDLDGARDGEPRQLSLVARIAAAVPVPIELGGGLRTEASVAAALAAGVDRVVLGTAALEQPALVERLARALGPRLAVGIDTRDGRVATHGWLAQSEARATDLARSMADLGVSCFIATDIARDGTLGEPNLVVLREILAAVHGATVIASGGVARVEHLLALRATGASGAIVGRAIYTGDLDLGRALAALAEAPGD